MKQSSPSPQPSTPGEGEEIADFARSILALVMLFVVLGSGGCATKPEKTDELVNLEKLIPGIRLDVRYATTNNFTGQQLYPVAKCYLRRQAAEQLKLVQAELRPMGLALKIFDAYRPLAVQKKLWAICPNPGFVADPAKGSKHNRGAAVDLTLIRL